MLEGLRYVRATKKVSTLIRFIAVFSVLGVPYITLMPVVARDLLGLDASGYGLLLSSLGIGGLSGALALAAVGGRAAAREAARRGRRTRTRSC